jgi:glycosyltransferase involved in cell wall biosynthesis
MIALHSVGCGIRRRARKLNEKLNDFSLTSPYSLITLKCIQSDSVWPFVSLGGTSSGNDRMARVFVSVLIDTYNHERFIEEAVRSVLAQDFPAADREIIVVDDGSTDRTFELLRKFEPQIRILRKSNGGQASAFNAGIPECRGEIIAFLDGDDWWAPGKLHTVSNRLAADASLGVVGHAIIEAFTDGSERIIAPERFLRLRLNSGHAADIFRLHRCYFGTSRLTLRADVARRVLPVPEGLVFEADEYLFILAAAITDVAVLTEPLTYYRLHGSNLFMAPGATSDGERRKQRIFAVLASELRRALPAVGAPKNAVASILEFVDAEAAQLRLRVAGGWPWETFHTETTIYRIQHRDASWKNKLFRGITMIPALALPPRWFYSIRAWIAAQSWYTSARKSYLPIPGTTKIHSIPEGKSTTRP